MRRLGVLVVLSFLNVGRFQQHVNNVNNLHIATTRDMTICHFIWLSTKYKQTNKRQRSVDDACMYQDNFKLYEYSSVIKFVCL